MIHLERHPTYVDGCWQCRISSVMPAASAMPTRSPEAVSLAAREKRWKADMPAYRELRRQGIQPRSVDGSAALAAKASDRLEVESGQLLNRRDLSHAKTIIEAAK
jgi:hypothetical protein